MRELHTSVCGMGICRKPKSRCRVRVRLGLELRYNMQPDISHSSFSIENVDTKYTHGQCNAVSF